VGNRAATRQRCDAKQQDRALPGLPGTDPTVNTMHFYAKTRTREQEDFQLARDEKMIKMFKHTLEAS